MDNRIINKVGFESFYFDPTKSTTKARKNSQLVDFYIFFSKDEMRIENICAFHVPYSYVYEYSHTSFQTEEEAFIIEILLHQKVVDVIQNPESKIEEIYMSLLNYFCYGEDFFLTLNANPKGGFGIIALFDESFSKPTITQIIEPDVNKGRFYLMK